MMNRRAAGYGGLRRGLRAPSGASDPDSILLALGASLLHWWEPREDLVTFNSTRIAQIDPLAGATAMIQGTVGNQPLWDGTGGPNGTPLVDLDSTARNMAATVSLASNHRTGWFVVCQRSAAAVDRYVGALTAGATPVLIDYSHNAASPNGLKYYLDFTAGTDFNGRTNDIISGNILCASRPLTAGYVAEYNGTPATTQPSNTNGLIAATEARMGYAAAATSGGKIAALILTTEPTDAITAVVESYVAAKFGIAIA